MTESPNRLERRKARTRAALVSSAQGFIARGELNAPVLEITQAADVGMGSFYNHFDSKEQLFQAAVDGALELLGDYLDSLTEGSVDPAEAFTRSFRITGRLFRMQPELSRVLIHSGPALIYTRQLPQGISSSPTRNWHCRWWPGRSSDSDSCCSRNRTATTTRRWTE
jgi:AcrR family transcriptional regulator